MAGPGLWQHIARHLAARTAPQVELQTNLREDFAITNLLVELPFKPSSTLGPGEASQGRHQPRGPHAGQRRGPEQRGGRALPRRA